MLTESGSIAAQDFFESRAKEKYFLGSSMVDYCLGFFSEVASIILVIGSRQNFLYL